MSSNETDPCASEFGADLVESLVDSYRVVADMLHVNTDTPYDMELHILALFMVLLGSLVGMCFPILAGKLGGEHRLQAYILPWAKNFGAGVILATGFVHMMVPSFEVCGPIFFVACSGKEKKRIFLTNCMACSSLF